MVAIKGFQEISEDELMDVGGEYGHGFSPQGNWLQEGAQEIQRWTPEIAGLGAALTGLAGEILKGVGHPKAQAAGRALAITSRALAVVAVSAAIHRRASGN